MMLEGHSVWVIGAGFLGSALAEACRVAGARVLTIDPAAVATLRGSAANESLLRHAWQRMVPDIVYCCTATHGGTAEDYRQAYLHPVGHLVRMLRGTRLVFCSSSSVYAGRGGVTVTEDTPPQADSECAQVLLQAEEVVLRGGGVVARLVPLYGPGRCELLRRFFQALPSLPGEARRRLNYVHRDDAVQALLLLGTQPWLQEGVFNVSGESFTKNTIYGLLEAAFAIEAESETSTPSPRGVSDMNVDCTRLRKLGWRPQYQMLSFAYEWMR